MEGKIIVVLLLILLLSCVSRHLIRTLIFFIDFRQMLRDQKKKFLR